MEFCGITGSFYNLIKSYVEYRYQKVQIGTITNSNTVCCAWKRSSHGVPQRSILRPLLFRLCINVLPTVLCNISVQVPFADETSVIITNINVFHIVLYCLIFMSWPVPHPSTIKDLWNVNKFYSTNVTDFQDNIETVFKHLNKWLVSNLPSFNFNKTNFIHLKKNI